MEKSKASALETIRRLGFFNRFTLPRQREIMDRFQLKVLSKGQLLFFEEGDVYVVVSGSILLKNHAKDILLPHTLSKFGEGDILNFKQESNFLFSSVEAWFYV